MISSASRRTSGVASQVASSENSCSCSVGASESELSMKSFSSLVKPASPVPGGIGSSSAHSSFSTARSSSVLAIDTEFLREKFHGFGLHFGFQQRIGGQLLGEPFFEFEGGQIQKLQRLKLAGGKLLFLAKCGG